MKRLLTLSALLLFSFNSSASDLMIPLSDYLEQNDEYMGDPNVAFYFNTRCSAINVVMLERSANFPELQEQGTILGQHFLRSSVQIRQLITPNESDAEHQSNTFATVSAISDAYVEVMNVNYPKTGIYFTDWMLEDLSLCSSFYDMDSK